jgi:hypothetical protein
MSLNTNIINDDGLGDILSLSDVSIDQFATYNYDMDSRWRSVAALEGSVGVKHVEPMASKTSIMSPPKLSKESPPRVWSPVQIDLRVDSNEAEVVVREAPYLLMKTHFECEKFSLDTILDTIEQTLNDSIENAYEFVASECTVSTPKLTVSWCRHV